MARQRAYQAARRKDPEFLAAERAKRSTPEYKAYIKAYHKEWYNRPGVLEQRREAIRQWGKSHPESRSRTFAKYYLNRRGAALAANVKRRAKAKGWAYDLDDHIPDLQARVDAGVCELTGYPFDVTRVPGGGRRFNAPSLDRIDPLKGYTHDNIRVVLYIVNVALNNWGENTLREVMTKWLTN